MIELVRKEREEELMDDYDLDALLVLCGNVFDGPLKKMVEDSLKQKMFWRKRDRVMRELNRRFANEDNLRQMTYRDLLVLAGVLIDHLDQKTNPSETIDRLAELLKVT